MKNTNSLNDNKVGLKFFGFFLSMVIGIFQPALASDAKGIQLDPKPVLSNFTDNDVSIISPIGKVRVIKFKSAVSRVAVGNPTVLDFTTVSPTEVYLLGKSMGTTNVVVWFKDGSNQTLDISVIVDLSDLARAIKKELPKESDVQLSSTAGSIILSGSVSDNVAALALVNLAEAHMRNLNRQIASQGSSGGSITTNLNQTSGYTGVIQIINLLKIKDPQQVMLEVKIAEVSKKLLEEVGVNLSRAGGGGSARWGIISERANSSLLNSAGNIGNRSVIELLSGKGALTANMDDNLVKVLAEPNIVAISGQEGSFLVGGKVFIPVTQAAGSAGGTSVSLQEKEFGIGLKFVPTVLDAGRINLKVAPEVSSVEANGIAIGGGSGADLLLPSFNTRKVSTTVQLSDGQSLVIGGLISNNITQNMNAFPFLGEIPVLGALFRSNSFKQDKTELVIVVSPKLVAPTNTPPVLPTDGLVTPNRFERILMGKHEGRQSVPTKDIKPDGFDKSVSPIGAK